MEFMPTYTCIVWLYKEAFVLRKNHTKYFPICVIRRHTSLVTIKFIFDLSLNVPYVRSWGRISKCEYKYWFYYLS
jgi:hypothetical protein